MGKILIYLGVVLMAISVVADSIVIADAWDDLKEINEDKPDWYLHNHRDISVMASIFTCSISLFTFACF